MNRKNCNETKNISDAIPESEQKFPEAVKLYQELKFKMCIEKCDDILASLSDSRSENKVEQDVHDLKKKVKKIWNLSKQATIYFNTGNYENYKKAEQFYTDVLNAEDENGALHMVILMNRAITRQKLDHHRNAILDFNRVLIIDSSYSKVFEYRAISFYRCKMFELCEHDCDQVIGGGRYQGNFEVMKLKAAKKASKGMSSDSSIGLYTTDLAMENDDYDIKEVKNTASNATDASVVEGTVVNAKETVVDVKGASDVEEETAVKMSTLCDIDIEKLADHIDWNMKSLTKRSKTNDRFARFVDFFF